MVAQPYDDPEVPRWTPVRALIWKEWRQQRIIALGLPAAMVVLCLLFTVLWTDAAGGGVAMVLWAAMVVALAANAFSGEADDRTCLFLGALPWPRPRLFWIKFGTALAVAVVVTVVVGLIVLFIAVAEVRQAPWKALGLFSPRLLPNTVPIAVGVVLGCVLTLSWSAIVASTGAGTLLSFLVTIMLGGLVTGVHMFLFTFAIETAHFGDAWRVVAPLAYLTWVTAVTLAGGWWLWSTPWPSRLQWFGALALVIVTPLMAPVLLLVAVVLLLVFGLPVAAGVVTSIICWPRPETATQEKSAREPGTACKRPPTGVQDNERRTEDRHQ